MVFQKEVTLPAFRRGYHLITRFISEQLPELPETGLLNILVKHTSAGITINENADPTVRSDFERFMNKMIPKATRFMSIPTKETTTCRLT